jgi:hypothetical protein
MSHDDAINRLREHVEKNHLRDSAYFSIAGMQELLAELDDVRGMFVTVETDNVALSAERDALQVKVAALKAQNERLLAKEAARIGKALRGPYSAKDINDREDPTRIERQSIVAADGTEVVSDADGDLRDLIVEKLNEQGETNG